MASLFRLAIAGSGFMGSTHRSAVAQLDSVEVAASSNWREIVSDPNVDAIDICLPTDLHARVAIEALANGKHVFCEKPMALTDSDCSAMIAAAREHKRVLMIGHVLRFWPEYAALKSFVDEHRHSVVDAVFTRRSSLPNWATWLADPTQSGGAILDLLIHDVDQSLLLFGKPAFISARSLGRVDTMEALLEYDDARTARIEGGWYPEGMPFHMQFAISAGRDELAVSPGDGGGAYGAELAYFAECVRTNSEPERCRPEEAADAVRLALLLRRARALDGKRVACEF